MANRRRKDALPRAERARLASLLDGRDKARITRMTGVTHKKDARRWYALCVFEAARQRQLGKAEARRFLTLLGFDIVASQHSYLRYTAAVLEASQGRAMALSQYVEEERILNEEHIRRHLGRQAARARA